MILINPWKFSSYAPMSNILKMSVKRSLSNQSVCSLRSRSNIAFCNSSCEAARMSYRILVPRSPSHCMTFTAFYQIISVPLSELLSFKFRTFFQTRDVQSSLRSFDNRCNLFIPRFYAVIWRLRHLSQQLVFLRVHRLST